MRALLAFLLFLPTVSAHAGNLASAEQAYTGKDYPQALKRYRQLAEQGNAMAQFNYAMMLKRGDAGTSTTPWQPWLLKAAPKLREAAYVLGLVYENGDGLPRSQTEATRWFLKAAEQGHTQAQLSVGTQYFLGRGAPKDMAAAARWYEKAADGGDMAAQYLIAAMYEHGNGVAADRSQALLWYSAAARQGDVAARLKAEAMARQP